ncbi:MAG: PH domain-containing protein [Tabrizicola sp.]|nr:PH domain-containing protein [Tabrizicola sp.]
MSETTTELPYDARPAMFRDSPLRFVFLILLGPLGVFALALIGQRTGLPDELVRLAMPVPVAVAGLSLLSWYLGTRSNRLSVDQTTVRHRRGILSKRVKQIAIPTIKSFEVSQSALHRLTGVCSIRIYTAGDQPEISLSGLPYPEELNDALEAARRE